MAQGAGWSDDFNDGSITDGNPVTWGTNAANAFPGNYDASSGDFAMSRPGNADDDILVAWVENMEFQDVYVRTQGVVLPGPAPEEVGGNLVLLGRLDAMFVTSYVLYLDTGGSLVLQISLGGALTDLAEADLGELNAASEVIMELNIVGDQLSGYAWRPGDPKPAAPQVSVTDTVFTSGDAGIAYAEDDDNTTGIYRWVMAQDVPFVDTLAGDFNADGKVDAADYVVWRKDPSAHGGDPAGYNTWRMNFGIGTGAGSLVGSAVPEPAALIQLLAAVAGLVGLTAGRWRCVLG
jgi:hypothetical protein